MRITLIHNPGAGAALGSDGEGLCRLIEARGHRVRYQSCAEDEWKAALEEDADLVVIAGGDGTVGRAAKALVGRDLPFTVLPVGTANNIAKTLGLTLRRSHAPVEALIDGWEEGSRLRFDVGVAGNGEERAYFIEGFGVGLLACTMPEADASPTLANLQDGEARVAYALQMLRDRLDACPPVSLVLTLDGRDLSGDYLLLEAMNMQFVGPNLYLAPACDLCDGMLDFLLIAPRDREALHRYLSSWQAGTLWPADLPTFRGRELILQWDGFPLHVDDLVWPRPGRPAPAEPRELRVTVEERALQFLLPAERG